MLRQWKLGAAFAAIAALVVSVGCSGDSSTGGSSKPATSSSSSSGSSSSESESSEPESSEAGSSASADKPAEGGWGTITGRFVYDGVAPEQMKINITKDIEYCSKNNPLEEELVVDPDSKGIQNVIVMLYLARGQEAPTPKADADSASAKVEVDNVNCRFEPHVQFVETGETVEFANSDAVAHNVKGDPFKNPAFNQSVASNASFEIPFAAAENAPVPISCTIHPWMKGWLVVKDHPYVAISAADGSFELKNVPSGEWEFQVWQEKAGYLKQLKMSGATKNLNRGRLSIGVHGEAEGESNPANDLGDILVPTSNF